MVRLLPVKPTVTLDDVNRLDVRVGTIEKVEEIEGSRKLVRLGVNFGEFSRSILVGMKGERGNPSEVCGRQALFVVNLAPREMAGHLSEGMLFDIGYANELTPVLAVPEMPVPDGASAG
jgi:tRNA-binding protein